MNELHFDYETTSACDISLGSYRYAADPSTRILMFAVAGTTGEPLLWSFVDPFGEESLAAEAMLHDGIQKQKLLYAHHAAFEIPLTASRLEADVGISPPDSLDVYRCTQAMCKRAAAPESLAAAAEFFGLGYKKDAIGKSLIDVFSIQTKSVTLFPPPGMKDPDTIKQLKNGSFTAGKKPANRTSNNPILDEEILWDWQIKVGGNLMTVREAWETFCAYCRNDVKVERELHNKLKHFELKGDELASFQFDLKMNFRGVPVNMEALRHADILVEKYKEKLEARVLTMTEGITSGQRAKLLEWLRERGYPENDLQAGTVEEVLEKPPADMRPIAIEVLRMRSLLSFAALKKLPVMRDAACPDHTVKGTTQWHGARTGRATGRIIQPQNFRKTTIEHSALCYQMICEGFSLDWFEELWESPLEAIASSIRHFIQPHTGYFYDIDYKGVEARLTSWLAGDEEGLKSIVAGIDQYKSMAAKLFKIPYEDVTKEQRTIAKPVVLGCCFGVGGKALMEALAKPPYNVSRTRKECDDYVKIYRETNQSTVKSWRDIEEAIRDAIRKPGEKFGACAGRLSFTCGRAAGISYLVMTLPSGRKLYYPSPQIKSVFRKYDEADMVEAPWKREKGGYWVDQISFYGKISLTNTWGRVATFGSRVFENAIQATGACLLNRGCIEAERRGYDIRLIVHDQALSLADGSLPLEGFMEAMQTRDEWASSFPLDCDGSQAPYYLKD